MEKDKQIEIKTKNYNKEEKENWEINYTFDLFKYEKECKI